MVLGAAGEAAAESLEDMTTAGLFDFDGKKLRMDEMPDKDSEQLGLNALSPQAKSRQPRVMLHECCGVILPRTLSLDKAS